MTYTLVTIAPDTSETRNNPVLHPRAVMIAVSETLHRVAPWMTRSERDRAAMQVAGCTPGTTMLHTATGYRFRIETDHARAQCAADDPIAGCTPHTTCPDHTPTVSAT